MILVGDIGGTKTLFSLYENQESPSPRFQEKFSSQEYPDFSSLVSVCFSKWGVKGSDISRACFALAGPIVSEKSQVTNLPWIVEKKFLEDSLGIPHVFLINDLEAHAYGLFSLREEDLLLVNRGKEKKGNRALLAAGTGLGEACLYWDGMTHRPFATEGGHVDFAPRNELEMELLRYLKKQFEHVSYERILSGHGFYQLYRFLIDMQLEKESIELRKKMSIEDPAKVITEAAINGSCKACSRVVGWFISIYAAEAGNIALKFLATGGLFIAGGIIHKLQDFLSEENFLEPFSNKGRFSSFLKEIPIKVCLSENTALLGAFFYAKNNNS